MLQNIESLQQSRLATVFFLGNSLLDYFVFLVIMLAVWVATKLIFGYLLHEVSSWAKQISNQSGLLTTLSKINGSISSAFYLYLSFYIALQVLNTHPFLDQIAVAILLIWTTYQVLTAIHFFIDYFTDKYVGSESESEADAKSAASATKLVAKIIIWSLGLLLILSNLGVNITSLVAGLGIGGIAVAFALQNLLADLFSSFAIYFDKPFKLGDFIILDKTMGTVEKIGIKTTRIRALQGEEIILPNQQLTNQEIHNYKQMRHRRIEFKFRVTYQTPTAKLRAIPQMIEKIILEMEQVSFDRAHFKTITDSGFEFDVVYNIDSGEHRLYMDTQQEINLQLLEALEKKNIKLAYPTNTVYLAK